MADYAPQVDLSHYGRGYLSKDRWLSYFYQLELVQSLAPASVLEVGPGQGVVTDMLRKGGITVTTCDIAEDLRPDIVGSVTKLPVGDGEHDCVLAAEVLEHIVWEDVPQALSELARASKSHVVISLPHPGYVFLFTCKLPLLPYASFFFQLPFFWVEHQFNGEHYWELGKKGYRIRSFVAASKEAGLELVSTHKYIDDPVHRLFVFKKA